MWEKLNISQPLCTFRMSGEIWFHTEVSLTIMKFYTKKYNRYEKIKTIEVKRQQTIYSLMWRKGNTLVQNGMVIRNELKIEVCV